MGRQADRDAAVPGSFLSSLACLLDDSQSGVALRLPPQPISAGRVAHRLLFGLQRREIQLGPGQDIEVVGEDVDGDVGDDLGYLAVAEPGAPQGLEIGLAYRSEEHTSELQSLRHLVCRLLLEKK